MTTTTDLRTTTTPALPLRRLYAMRGGYLLMALGLALVKWPLLADASTMPLYEGVTLCLLTAMSLLAFLGLRYPVKMLPVLLFESLWKLLWLGLVALPNALDGTLDQPMTEVLISCSLIVVIAAITPWGHMWSQLAQATGDRWR